MDERAVKLEIDTRLAQRRDNQQEEAIPHSMGAEEVVVYDREHRSQGDRISSLDPEISKVILKQGNTGTT